MMRPWLPLLLAGLTMGCAAKKNAAPAPVPGADSKPNPYWVKSPPIGEKLQIANNEWKKHLSSKQFRVLRKEGTERAFTGALWDHKGTGTYRCAACGAPLFDSKTKFKSGTGWPSFWAPIAAGRVGTRVDGTLGMTRTEIHCTRCGGHLGHIFPDGPKPTGQRYCVNSASLAFDSGGR